MDVSGTRMVAVNCRRPSGALRLLLRAPILLYRARMGWLLGHRFVYLVYRGRRTGQRREAVLEVVRYDRAVPAVVVVAGWGAGSDWYRNLQAAEAIEVRLGRQRWTAPRHRFLDCEAVTDVLGSYQRAHPRAWARVAPMLGLPAAPSDPRWREAIGAVHGVEFTPR